MVSSLSSARGRAFPRTDRKFLLFSVVGKKRWNIAPQFLQVLLPVNRRTNSSGSTHVDDEVNLLSHLGQDRWSARLEDCPWKSIEDETWIAILCLQTLLNNPMTFHREELPLIINPLPSFPKGCSLSPLPQDISGRDLRNVLTIHHPLGLSPFSCPEGLKE